MGGTPINSNHRFLREEAVSGEGGDDVHREIGNRTVSGMFSRKAVLLNTLCRWIRWLRQDIPRVEIFQALAAAEMKQYHNRDDFRV